MWGDLLGRRERVSFYSRQAKPSTQGSHTTSIWFGKPVCIDLTEYECKGACRSAGDSGSCITAKPTTTWVVTHTVCIHGIPCAACRQRHQEPPPFQQLLACITSERDPPESYKFLVFPEPPPSS